MTKQGFIVEFENNKLYIKGWFNVNGQLFKALRRLGDFRDYSDVLYDCDTTEPYYGLFLFQIEDIKPMRLNEFLDRTGYSTNNYLKSEQTMAEWFIELATN